LFTIIKKNFNDPTKFVSGCNENYRYIRMESILSMVLRYMISSVVLRLRSGACDFDDGQVIIVHGKSV